MLYGKYQLSLIGFFNLLYSKPYSKTEVVINFKKVLGHSTNC